MQDALNRSFHPGLGNAAGLHRLQQRAQDNPGVGWIQQDVHTGLQGLNGRFAAPVPSSQSLHLHGIGNDQTPKSQLVPQNLFQYRLRKGGRTARVALQGRDRDVGRHDRHDAGPDRLPKGNPLDLFQAPALCRYHRQGQMGIHLGVAVAGKVLGRCQNSGLLGSGHECRAQAPHHLRVLSIGTDVDDRICRIVVDVHHRGKYPVDSQGSSFLGGDASLPVGPLLRSGGPHGHVPGQGKGIANAECGPPLEVGTDQQGNGSLGLQSVDEDG